MQDIIMLGLNARSKRLNAMFANSLKMKVLARVTYRLESYTWRHVHAIISIGTHGPNDVSMTAGQN